MHNILLGYAEKLFEFCIEKDILKEKGLEETDQLIQKVPILSNAGRVAGSILISFKSFRAEELKNWAFYFSLYCLKDLIPWNYFNMWQMFVRSCHRLLKPIISIQEIDDAHSLLVLFAEKFAEFEKFAQYAYAFVSKKLLQRIWTSLWFLILLFCALQRGSSEFLYQQT